jgi:hypothetical protein
MPPVQPLRNGLYLLSCLYCVYMLIRMLKGVDNSVGIAFDKGIDDANIYDPRRMMSKNRTGKGRSCHTAHCKKMLAIFASPAGMSLTKLSLAGNN